MRHEKIFKWLILFILTASILNSCGEDSVPEITEKAEELDDYATDNSIAVTGNSSAITPVSAEILCKANITQGGSASIELGVMYSTEAEKLNDFNGSKATTKDLVGNAYKVTLSSLKPNTTYFYRSYVTCGGINNYGKVKSFTTQSVASPITIYADTITAFSAYLHAKREISEDDAKEFGFTSYDGFVINDKNDSIEFKGRFTSSDSYYYDEYAYAYVQPFKAFQDGNYRVIVNSLQPATTYYYKAYTRVNGGYTYGELKSFTTGVFDKPSVSIPTDISLTSVSVIVTTNDIKDYRISSIGVDFAIDATTLETSYKTSTSYTTSGTEHPVTISSLNPNTLYYMRPFVSVYTGSQTQKVYGETVTFKTAGFSAPTSNVNEVTYNSASITVITPQSSLYKMVGIQYCLKKDEIDNGNVLYSSNYTTETSSIINITGLAEQTTYYYRPVYYALKGSTYYAYERYDNVYGEVKTFVTTEAPPRQTMTIATAGVYGWNTYNYSSYTNCLKSNNNGIVSSTARSILYFTVEQASTLYFSYRVSSESGSDKMTIKVDNNTICSGISGTIGKASNSVSLAKGDHNITLEYSKDDRGNSNEDCGYIYNIAINGEYLSNGDIVSGN